MLKILWKRKEIAPEEQFLLLSTIFSYLMLDFCVKRRIRFSLRDQPLFEITEIEITRVDCIFFFIRRLLETSVFEIWRVDCIVIVSLIQTMNSSFKLMSKLVIFRSRCF